MKWTFGGVVVVFCPRATVGHQQGRRVGHLALCDGLRHVAVQWKYWDGVLVTWIAVKQLGHVELVVQASLGGWHQLLLFCSHDYPLSVLSVSYQVHFDVLGIVVFAVLLEDRFRLLQRLQVVHPIPDSWACGIHSWTRNYPCFHHVTISKYIGSGSLRISRGGHAIGQVGGIDPHRVFMQSPSWPHVRVGIDKSRGYGLACSIDYLCSCPIQGAGFADSLDAVVFNQDVSLLNDFIAFHGDDARIFE